MKEQILAKSYARALMELGSEHNVDIASELTKLTEVINQSNDLENLLFLEVFSNDEKLLVMKEVMGKINAPDMLNHFVQFLIQEKRITLLPTIFKDVIVIDDDNKGFLKGNIEGAVDNITDEIKNKMIDFVKKNLPQASGKKIVLNYQKNSDMTAGYKVSVDDLQLDASLENQLEQFKQDVLSGN